MSNDQPSVVDAIASYLGLSRQEVAALRDGRAVLARRIETAVIRRLVKALRPIRNLSTPLLRLGPERDGGYLVPDDLEGIVACYSPGVERLSGFELDCAKRGMRVFMADASVDAPAAEHPAFHFTKKFVGARNSGNLMTMDRWVEDTLGDEVGDLLLQMDIEGEEYVCLLNASEALLRRFRVIVIELHGLGLFWDRAFFRHASAAIERILETHACLHIHPNNHGGVVSRDGLDMPRLAEFTFLRRDRLGETEPATEFPHPLDRDNTREPTLVLPDCWYRRS